MTQNYVIFLYRLSRIREAYNVSQYRILLKANEPGMKLTECSPSGPATVEVRGYDPPSLTAD